MGNIVDTLDDALELLQIPVNIKYAVVEIGSGVPFDIDNDNHTIIIHDKNDLSTMILKVMLEKSISYCISYEVYYADSDNKCELMGKLLITNSSLIRYDPVINNVTDTSYHIDINFSKDCRMEYLESVYLRGNKHMLSRGNDT